MSTTIDQRVVEMQFDNKNFERNIQTSLSTLDKFKSSLNMNGATKGFEQIDNAAKKVNMSGLANAVESVRLKFSALEVMAVTALANITNSIVNTGKQMVKSFTIDPIRTGFAEYETQIGAIQTILANTSHQGTNLQQVNRALDELNTYADKTIYNFTQMTRNIGTFTAAGVDLRTSVDSIKGIANLAAVSGSTSQQASTAMYQLSQALAAGKVSLMDWNSVVNAGMGGKVFQDALIRTSELLGTGAQQAVDAYGSFRASLTQGEWLTTQVLTETLKQFAGAYSEADLIQQGFTEEQARSIAEMAKTAEDAATKVKTFTQLFDTLKESAQSGWTQTWEILIGDFEEAKEVLTEISNVVGSVISKSAEARNEVLSGGLSSGWKQLLGAGIADEAGYIESIQEIARANGDAFDKIIADSGNFNDALKKGLREGVISAETLSNAVFNLKEKMSGMSEEERKTAGYTSEMVAQIETLASELKDGSVSMAEFTEKILRPSGRENIIQALWNAAKGLMSVITPIKEAFREIFPPATADQLYKITEGLRKLTERLTLSETASQNLKSTFKGLFAVVNIVGNMLMAVMKAVGSLLGCVSDLGGGLLSITGSFGEWLVKLNETIETTDYFGKILGRVVNFVKAAATAIKNFVTTVAQNFKIPGLELFHNLLERVQIRMAQVGEAAGNMKSGVVIAFELIGDALANCQFVRILQTIWNAVRMIAGCVVNALGGIGSAIASSLGNANFSEIIDLLNGISFGAIAIGITKFVNGFHKALDDIGSIKQSFIEILDSVRGCFEAYQTQLQAGALLKIASAIAILTAAIVVLSLIDSDKLSVALGGITMLFADLMTSMAIFNKIGGKATDLTKSIAAMLGIATAVLVLAIALKKLGDLDIRQLATGLTGVAGLTAIVVAAAKAMSSSSSTIIKGATRMLIFAVAIKVLASVCEGLSKLSWEELAKGLAGVWVLLMEVSVFMNTAKFSGKSITTATGIVILAAAIKILASACKDFGQMDWEEIAKGFVSVGALLAEVALFTKLSGNAKHVISTGLALIGIAAAVKIFASAVGDLGLMSWKEIAKGLVAMAGALAAVTVAMKLMPKNMVGIGVGLIAVSAALVIMAGALGKMGDMSWEKIAKGLVTLGGAMGILAIALNAMTGTLAGSAAMLVAASALLVMTPVLSILGAMSWKAIAKGLVALAGAFTVIGVAGLVLTPLVPVILGLSAALALIGVSVLGIGAGLATIAVGLTALAAAGTAGATAIVAALTIIITGIIALIPAIVKKLGEAVVALCQVLIDGIPAIGKAIKALVLTLVDVLVECVPQIAEGALKLVDGVLKALVKYTPSIVDSIFKFLIGVLEGIARNLPGLIQAAINVLMAFFSGIVEALKGIDTDTLLQGIIGIGLMAAIMAALAAVASLVPGAMVGVLGIGAVIAELALVIAAIGALAQIPGLDWLINEGGTLLQSVGTAIGGFIGGIVGGFMSGVSSQFPKIATDLSNFMINIQPFVQGAASIDPAMMDGVKALAEIILILTATNILEGLTSWLTGGSSLAGFAEELVPFGRAMKQFAAEIAGIDGEVISNAAIAGKTLAEMAATLPNTGGVLGWFTGENDMNTFGEQLVPFGRAIKSFGNEVDGLKADVITEAATAGKAIAEMATTLPNSGGVVGFFVGENDMDAFGEQLVPFGRAMKEYGEVVSGLKADVIQNSVTAGKALMELADTVPNTGGVVAWFTGDNDLAKFGEQIVPFGKAMKDYSLSVTGLKADVVVNSANAAKALVELADNLPNTGGIASWFAGDNDIADFGKSLVSFGDSFKAYYDSVAAVNVAQLDGVIEEFKVLVDVANNVKKVDTSGMSGFATSLKKLGDAGITEFINAFHDASPRITTAASTMVTTFVNAAYAQKLLVSAAFTSMANTVVTAFTSQRDQYTAIGENIMTNISFGARSKENSIKNGFIVIVSNCLVAIRSKYQDFYDAGAYLGRGVAAGIESHSPKSGLNGVVNRMRGMVESDIDPHPTIKPILDLSDVRAGVHTLSALLSKEQAAGISADMEQKNHRMIQNGENVVTPTGNSYNFTQNNYSPKALSRIDIYRQTKNQFSVLKGLV